MTGIDRTTEKLGNILEVVIAVFFFVILATTITLVTLRYVFNTSIKGGYELTNYLFIYTTAIGAAISIGRHEHIKIDYFVNMLGGGTRKAADALVQLLVAGLNGVLIYLSIPWIRDVGSFESPVLRIPNWTVQIAVPIGSVFAIMFCILNIIRDLRNQAGVEGDDHVAPTA